MVALDMPEWQILIVNFIIVLLQLILLANILLIDYSSVIFEFIFLNKSYIRYVNNLAEYSERRGLSDTYYELPDPIINSPKELYESLAEKMEKFDYNLLIVIGMKFFALILMKILVKI